MTAPSIILETSAFAKTSGIFKLQAPNHETHPQRKPTTAKMRRIEALVLLSTFTTNILAAESSRPRGVSPECMGSPILFPTSSSKSYETQLNPTNNPSSQSRSSTKIQNRSLVSRTLQLASNPPKSTTITAIVQMDPTNLAPLPVHTSPPSHLHNP